MRATPARRRASAASRSPTESSMGSTVRRTRWCSRRPSSRSGFRTLHLAGACACPSGCRWSPTRIRREPDCGFDMQASRPPAAPQRLMSIESSRTPSARSPAPWNVLMLPSGGVDGRWTVDVWVAVDARPINGGGVGCRQSAATRPGITRVRNARVPPRTSSRCGPRQHSSVAGSTTRKVEPEPGALSRSMRPPWASALHRAIARPRPTPPAACARPASTR